MTEKEMPEILNDITSENDNDLKLKYFELKCRYRTLFNETGDAVYIKNLDGTIVDHSSSLPELLGYKNYQGDMTELFESLIVSEKISDIIASNEEKGYYSDFRVSFIKKDNSEITCEAISRPLKMDDGTLIGYQVVLREITSMIRANAQIDKHYSSLQKAMDGIVRVLASTVEARDPYTAGHQKRVADLASGIAVKMGLSPELVNGIKMAGLIHDLGKVKVPSEILCKPGRITKDEFNLIKLHPEVGFDIIKNIEFPWPLAAIILQHHERIDGSGYPFGLTGEHILIEAKIIGVADVVEAMASHRPYRPALGVEAAIHEVKEKRGISYDRDVVDACIHVLVKDDYRFNDVWNNRDMLRQ